MRPVTRGAHGFVCAIRFGNHDSIKHVVVIFDENITFDLYFATYPVAANPPGEPTFTAEPGTPSVNGLTGSLLTNNPNGTNPARLDRSQAITCSNNHSYTPEQAAAHGGLLDKFVATSCGGSRINLNYFDANTVTAMWNYAQRPLGASCARQSNFALFGKPRGVAQRLKNVFTLQIRIVRQQLLDGMASTDLSPRSCRP